MYNPKFLFFIILIIGHHHALQSHGTSISPQSRVHKVFESNPENPSFPLAAAAVMLDGTNSYYTWNQVSREIPQAVAAGLPAGFDYSPWIPDGQLASAGRVNQIDFPNLTHIGLDQVSPDWPKSEVIAGDILPIDYFATAPHEPSVWDVWMTTSDWDPNTPLNWSQMEFLVRPNVILIGNHYYFDVQIPAGRSGHHVLWIAWQRDDPQGEVFISASDLMVAAAAPCPQDLVLTSLDTSEYHVSKGISCSATIEAPMDVTFRVGQYLLLMPTFQLNEGASIEVIIDDCAN